jgi:hypothetical protein
MIVSPVYHIVPSTEIIYQLLTITNWICFIFLTSKKAQTGQQKATVWRWLNCKVKLFGQALNYLIAECSFNAPNDT